MDIVTERVADRPEGFQTLVVADIAAVSLLAPCQACVFVVADSGLQVEVRISLPALEQAIAIIKENNLPHLAPSLDAMAKVQ